MITRQRAFSGFILLCVLTILVTASYLRFDQSSTSSRSQLRDLNAVSRVVYYRVEHQAGPRFQLSGGEQSIRLITHLALQRSAAWPVHRYRPKLRYPYGLELRLLHPDGTTRWSKTVYVSSAVSKGHAKNGAWTQEAAFSETRTFVPTDARTTSIDLPSDLPVNSSLQVRLISSDSGFAMVRAYGLSTDSGPYPWLEKLAMSPSEKRDLVQGITYLDWDEIDEAQRKQRLQTKVTRLTAASDVSKRSKIVPLYISDYRVLPSPKVLTKNKVFMPPWTQTFAVQGPTRLKLTLQFNSKQLLERASTPHLLHMQRIDERGHRVSDVETFVPHEEVRAHQLVRFIEIPSGQHTLKLRWDPPKPGFGAAADLRSRRNKISVSHARDHGQTLSFSLQDTSFPNLDLRSDSWNQPEFSEGAELDPLRWRSTYYYLSPKTGPIDFLIPEAQETARMFKIRASDWDLAPHATANKNLAFAFLDAQRNKIDAGHEPIAQDFDRDRWVTVQGTLNGQDTPEPLRIGVGTEQNYSGIAPKGTRWIRLEASAAILVQVSARLPSQPNFALAAPKQDGRIKAKPRRWLPMRASQHAHFDQQGWVMSLKSTLRYPGSRIDQGLQWSSPKSWKPLSLIGRPALFRILEESPYQETDFGLQREGRVYASLEQLWRECHSCWVEIPPYRSHRVLDRRELADAPQALWMTELTSSSCAFEIDGQKSTFGCPVHRERMRMHALSGGSHLFRWQSDAYRDRLWLNRSSVPVRGQDLADGPTLYAERAVTRLQKRGQVYAVASSGTEEQYLNFRIYRPLKKTSAAPNEAPTPLPVEITLDSGTPPRHFGKLFPHFTPSRKQIWVPPSATPELIFLDAEQSGPFERFDFGFRIGQDIKSGQHQVRIRALGDETLWVRAFEQGRSIPASTSSISGQLDPPK